ncbi:MAG: hypothetical protein CMD13_00185 [Flavobacteriales bacterium]|nr:hypothetical protein [Flavobacteriales bacterium]|tara:strand:- start:1771 stop:3621 length:1851 start_codon:yes stop_codon:yes gene_type:complete
MNNLILFINQLKRLINRDVRDIFTFLKYKIRMIPTSLKDHYYGKIKLIKHEAMKNAPDIILNRKDSLIHRSLIYKNGENILKKSEVELLGKVINIGWPPKWETEETGIWSKESSSKIRYYGKDITSDIKIIWELHRLQWMPSISAYYAENSDEEGMEELLEIIVNYIQSHPFGRTISWMEGIEITLRTISIIETLSYMKEFVTNNPKIGIINSYLAINAVWLEKHLSEKWRRNNNHLLLELVGLTILGEYLRWHPDSNKWIEKGSSKLLDELKKQTYGKRNWEPTTAYHRFVTESLLVLEYYCDEKMNTNKTFKSIKEIIGDLVESLFWMSDLSFKMPLIGDDDAGIVFPRSGNIDSRDNTETLELAKKLGYQDPRKIQEIKIWNEQGMGIIHNGNMSLSFVSGAPKGPGRQASHRHLDMLSIALNHKGKEVIIDGGTGVYFGSDTWRDYFRSEKCHSGIYSKKIPWGKISNLFEIKKPPYGYIKNLNGDIEVSCEHPSGKNQIREISINDKSIVIRDQLVIDEPIIGFMFKDEVTLLEIDNGFKIKIGDITITHTPKPREVKFQNINDDHINIKKAYDGKAYYSTSYGIIRRAARVEFIHERGILAKTIIKEINK